MNAAPNQRFPLGDTPAPAGHGPALDPAAQNLNWAWSDCMGRLGFVVVIVEVQYAALQLPEFPGEFWEPLSAELRSARLGHYDSMAAGNGSLKLYIYLGAKSLPAGLQLIQRRLESLKILPLCKIGYADLQERVWRVFYPALPGPIAAPEQPQS